MGQKEITITIKPTGVADIEAHNFKGTSCKAATKPLEDALGATDATSEVKPKPEMRMVDSTPAGTIKQKR